MAAQKALERLNADPVGAVTSSVKWRPNSVPQAFFVATDVYEVLYGGAAGGGKSQGLLMGALRDIEQPGAEAILFRRTFPELDRYLIARSRGQYKREYPGAQYNDQKHIWRFPGGGLVHFSHLEHEHSVHQHQSSEYQFIGFDELTSFTKKQYVYMLSRARSSTGVPIRIRAGTNPGNEGHDWVFERWGPWLNPKYELPGRPQRVHPDTGAKLPPALPGEVLWYVNTGTTEDDEVKEEWVPEGTPGALSRTFIPALATDNPDLMRSDPGYVERLKGQDPVTRAQLIDGNWLKKAAKGEFFKRGWFTVLEAVPVNVVARCRYWDLAGAKKTEGTKVKKKGDFAAGVKVSRTVEGMFVIEHVARGRGTPGDTRALVKTTVAADGHGVDQWIEQDPGQAGLDQIESYVRELAGYNVRGRPKHIDKITAASPVSAQAAATNVAVVRGEWNEAFFDELEAFPQGAHDDQVDGLSGACTTLFEQKYFVGPVDEESWME